MNKLILDKVSKALKTNNFIMDNGGQSFAFELKHDVSEDMTHWDIEGNQAICETWRETIKKYWNDRKLGLDIEVTRSAYSQLVQDGNAKLDRYENLQELKDNNGLITYHFILPPFISLEDLKKQADKSVQELTVLEIGTGNRPSSRPMLAILKLSAGGSVTPDKYVYLERDDVVSFDLIPGEYAQQMVTGKTVSL